MKKISIALFFFGSTAFLGLIVAGIVMAKTNLNSYDVPTSFLSKFKEDEIIVKFRGDTEPFRIIKVPSGKIGENLKEFLKRGDVVYAEPNYIAFALMTPNDPYFSYQWHLANPVSGGIQMDKAWDISTGENSVKVAVVDTGIAYENYSKYCQAPDLAQTCFLSGYDFINGDSHPNDDNNHGTHVAGTIAQSTNNNQGVAGVAFNTCLMPVKVLDSQGSGSYAVVAQGIRWATDQGAKIINLSLGGSASDNTLKEAVKYAFEKGVTVIAACGNENSANCLFPAAYDEYVISVGATQYDEQKAPYSNYGPSLDLMAPGGNTKIDQNNDGYVDGVLQQTFKSSLQTCNFGYYFFQGTSMAAPHVSGVAALLLAKGNANNPQEIRTILQETAKDLGVAGRDDVYGYGLIDAYAALQWHKESVCATDSDCNDNNECTSDICLNPSTENSYCQNAPLQENVTCSAGICCQGKCKSATCSNETSCNDNNACTIDICENAGTCSASCSHQTKTQCQSGDGCCPAGCTNDKDSDCPTSTICWNGENQYLYRNANQAKKFCKCAQGNYGYKSYSYNLVRKVVSKYLNSGNNENWETATLSSLGAIYEVKCSDEKIYSTNQSYFYPK